jgi:hypothetical protein
LRMIWIGIARVECGYSDIGWIGIAFWEGEDGWGSSLGFSWSTFLLFVRTRKCLVPVWMDGWMVGWLMVNRRRDAVATWWWWWWWLAYIWISHLSGEDRGLRNPPHPSTFGTNPVDWPLCLTKPGISWPGKYKGFNLQLCMYDEPLNDHSAKNQTWHHHLNKAGAV